MSVSVKYYAVFLTMKDEELSKQHRPAHLEFLKEERALGNILMNGKFTDGSGGLVIYKASDDDALIELVEEDPYIKLKARNYEFHEWEMESDYQF